jgi:hypothetical protein
MADKIIPPRRGEILTGKGIGTTRFMEYLERTAATVNDSATAVDAQIIQNLSAAVFALQEQIGSDQPLTWDCDSLTWDSTEFSFDMDEA